MLSHQNEYGVFTQLKHGVEEEGPPPPPPEEQELDDATVAQLDDSYAMHPIEPQLGKEPVLVVAQLREVWHQ